MYSTDTMKLGGFYNTSAEHNHVAVKYKGVVHPEGKQTMDMATKADRVGLLTGSN